MRRRNLLRASLPVLAGALLGVWSPPAALAAEQSRRPNVLLIITDQQFSEGMSCRMGKRDIDTPGMDRLAARGLVFERAYTANPLCMPARTAIFSGHYPHQTGVQTNARGTGGYRRYPCLGTYFSRSGYETAYFGKWHNPYKLRAPEESGFQTISESGSLYNTREIVAFLKKEHPKPFLAVASFMNPHNVCEWSRFQKMKSGPLEGLPPVDRRPAMLPNHAPPANETDIMTFMRKSYQAHRLFPVGGYSEADWRRLSWGYYRLIERVDDHIAKILDVLAATGLAENTVVVFTSDHGDCHGAHRWNQKTVFYDESARVPLIVSFPGKHTRGTTSDHLVNTGVDLGPTLLDFAGIAIPDHMPGRSLRPIAEGKARQVGRAFVVVENRMVQCEPVDGVSMKPDGRMVRSRGFKYCLYSEGKRRESLVDMENDPLEMVNQVANPKFRRALLEHRRYLRQFAVKHKDETALSMLKAVEGK